jgi:hypothetical protein
MNTGTEQNTAGLTTDVPPAGEAFTSKRLGRNR